MPKNKKIEISCLSNDDIKQILNSDMPVELSFISYKRNAEEVSEQLETLFYLLANTPMPNIVSLHIEIYAGLSKEVQKKLASVIGKNKQLESLTLKTESWENDPEARVASAIRNSQTLTELNLWYLGEGEVATDCYFTLLNGIETNRSIRTLMLGTGVGGQDGSLDRIATMLGMNGGINRLVLSGHDISRVKAEKFWHDINGNEQSALCDIELQSCIFEEHAIALFCAELAKNSRMHAIKYSYCTNRGSDTSVIVGEALADMLRNSQSLRHLSVTSMFIGSGGLEMIADALRANDTLETLDLSENPLAVNGEIYDDKGMQALGSMLASSKSLKQLVLGKCYDDVRRPAFSAAAIQYLADALAKNSTLEELNLFSDNQSRNASLVPLFIALQGNRALRHLELSYNDCGVDAFADMIRANQALKTIAFTNVGKEMYTKILSALELNNSLVKLTEPHDLDQLIQQQTLLKRNRDQQRNQDQSSKPTRLAVRSAGLFDGKSGVDVLISAPAPSPSPGM